MEDVTIIVPLSKRGNPARFLFKENSYTISALGATLNILRAGRTDQTVSVDYTITGFITSPQSGTATFAPGEIQVAVQMTAPTTGSGVLKLSNPLYISGINTTPPELGTRAVVNISANIPATGRNVLHTIDAETGKTIDDRFYPTADSCGRKNWRNTEVPVANIVGLTKANPAQMTVDVDNGYLDFPYDTTPEGAVIQNMSGSWGAALNGKMVRLRNISGNRLTFDLYFDHVIPGYHLDGQGVETSIDEMGANPLNLTGLSGSWPGDGELLGPFRKFDQTDEVSTSDAYDQRVYFQTGTVGADTGVVPRNGLYFIKDRIRYNRPNDMEGREPNLKGGNSGQNKPRSFIVDLPNETRQVVDEEFWFGFSIYLPSDYPDETGVTGGDSRNIVNVIDVPSTSNRGIGSISIATPGNNIPNWRSETTWVLRTDWTELSIDGDNKTWTDLGSIEEDKGKWTDWVWRIRWNPFSVDTTASSIPGGLNQFFEGNKGICEIWKSTGPVVGNNERVMERVFSVIDGPVGTVPGAGSDEAKLQIDVRQYKFGWHRQPTSITTPIELGIDEVRLGRVVEEGTGYSDVHPTQQTEPIIVDPPTPDPDPTFVSDAVCWIDTGTECGDVPISYANYQMLRTMALHINSAEVNSFSVNNDVIVIYAHPTFNDHTQYRPPFLSSWSFTGNIGSINVPTRDGGTQACPVYYYQKVVSGLTAFNWGWRSADIEDALSYFVGWFLFPSTTVVSAVHPEPYRIVSDISASYTPFARDWLYDPSPSTRPATTLTATSWADVLTKVQGASSGDVIEIPSGVYEDEGLYLYTNLQFDPDNPVWIVPPETTLSGSTIPSVSIKGDTRFYFDNCQGIRIWGVVNTGGTDVSFHRLIEFLDNCSYLSVENCDFRDSSSDTPTSAWETLYLRGRMNRIVNCHWNGKTSAGNIINFVPTVGDNTASQFNIIRWNEFKNFNEDELIGSIQNSAYIRLGGNENYEAEAYTLVQYNYFSNWHVTPQDDEWLVIKSCGNIIANNVNFANIGSGSGTGYRTRNGAWTLVVGNFDDTELNSNFVPGVIMDGIDPASGSRYTNTRLIHARNAVKNFIGHSGYVACNQQNADSTNRYPANNSMVVEMYAYNIQDEFFQFDDSLSVNKTTSSNVHFKKIFVDTNFTLANEDYNISSVVQFENCKATNTNGFVISGVPSGLTAAAPIFYDRGDGTFVTDDALLSAGIQECIPVALQGPVIANLGTTYNNPTTETVVARFYVDGATGNDSADGSLATPWKSINKAAITVTAQSGGHVDILIAPGTYENEPIIPQNSGLSDTERIRFRPNAGVVTITGPLSGGLMAECVNTQTFEVSYVDIGNPNYAERLVFDGWGGGPGTFDYSQFPFDNSNIDRICEGGDFSDYCGYYFRTQHIEGGFGHKIRGTGNRTQNFQFIRLGTPDYVEPQPDIGDMTRSQSGARNNLFENGTIYECGHTLMTTHARNEIMRHLYMIASWSEEYYNNGAWKAASVATLDANGIKTLGNHTGGHQENTLGRNIWEDVIIKRVRRAFLDSDKTQLTDTKIFNMEGEKCIWRQNFFLDNDAWAFHANARTKIGGIANDHRVYHNVVDGLRGPSGSEAIYISTPDVTSRAFGWHIKNNVFMNLNRMTIMDLDNDDNVGGPLEGFIFAGNYLPANMEVQLKNHPDSGNTVEWFEANYPNQFYGNTFGSAPGFVSANQDSNFSNVYVNYKPDTGSALINAGVALTNANGSGSSSTTLVVDDASYFIDNRGHPDPLFGPYATTGYQLHIEGHGNVGIAAVDYDTNTITLKSPASWANNAKINVPHTGSGPDIGAVQT